jgi:hypothetical protein
MSRNMKKIILALLSFFIGTSVSADTGDYRVFLGWNLRGSDLEKKIEIENIYWSKIQHSLYEAGLLKSYNILALNGGSTRDDVTMAASLNYGSIENYQKASILFPTLISQVRDTLDADTLEMIDAFNPPVDLQYLSREGGGIYGEHIDDWRFARLNYSETANPSAYINAENSIAGPIIKKIIDLDGAHLVGWGNAQIISPVGTAYGPRAVTWDLYKSFADTINSAEDWSRVSDDISVDFLEINKLRDYGNGRGFWKSQIYRRVIWIDSDGELKSTL